MAEELFLDKHGVQLIQRVKNIGPILDGLLSSKVLNEESFNEIRSIPKSEDKMKALLSGPLEKCGVKGKQIFYEVLNEHEPNLLKSLKRTKSEITDKEQEDTMMTKKILNETLNDLSSEELDEFKSLILWEKGPFMPRSRMEEANTRDIVELIVETYSQECVQLTKRVLKKMNRIDLMQRLFHISPETKEEQHPLLSEMVKTMVSIIELLLEVLKDLSARELKRFVEVLRHIRVGWSPLFISDTQEIVFSMVWTYGKKSVDVTKRVLMVMGRTHLVQRMSESRPKQKPSGDEHLSALINKGAELMAVKELVLETFNDLSYKELKNLKWWLQFVCFQRSLPYNPWRELYEANSTDQQVKVMLEKCGQQLLDVTVEVFMDMNRTDLVWRLSETSSGPRGKHSLDEHWPELIQRVETMASVIELLLDTLKDLSYWELQSLNRILQHQTSSSFLRTLPDISLTKLDVTDMQDMVFSIVQTFGQKSVEMTETVLMKMTRKDLVQRMSDRSSGNRKKKHSAVEHPSELIQRVATIAAVKQSLLETLNDLSNNELKKFKVFWQLIVKKKGLPDAKIWRLFEDRPEIVELMVENYGQQAVEFSREVFIDIGRTDLVQRLPTSSSGLKEKQSENEHRAALFERQIAMAPVKRFLLETLKDLRDKEFVKFKWLLLFTYFQKRISQISWNVLRKLSRADLMNRMVETCGQRSVEVTMEVFMDMNRTDLVQRLAESSSGLKGKHQSDTLQKEVTVTSLQEALLETLEDLCYGELEQFKWLLLHIDMKEGIKRELPRHQMEMADRVKMVELMVEIYGHQSVEVTREVLMIMRRRDLVQKFSDISYQLLASGPSRSLEFEGCGSAVQDSSDWAQLEPEMISTDVDDAPIYSVQSGAGNFECSVSHLRWVCKRNISFEYKYCSWEEPMKRMENMNYMPAGPLIDITVIAGELNEVYLPHWICIDDIPKISQTVAVLHISDCGDVLEKPSEVTASHVKLSEPVFSPRAFLMKAGLPVKISCSVLIYYKPNTSFLKLHVYLAPHDPALQQALDKKELLDGYKIIRKSRPDQYLKMQECFKLTADIDTAKILPEKITLRYDSQDPNFYEVFIENPDRNFHLTVSHTKKGKSKCELAWTCEIRKDDYQPCGPSEEKHSVDELSAQMQKAATITTEKERLLHKLEHLRQDELKIFKWVLADSKSIQVGRVEHKDMTELVDLLVETFPNESMEVTKEIFRRMQRNDLV